MLRLVHTQGGDRPAWPRAHSGTLFDKSLKPFSGRYYISIERKISLRLLWETGEGWALLWGCPRRGCVRHPKQLCLPRFFQR